MGEIECPDCGGLRWQFIDEWDDRIIVECWGCGREHKLWKKVDVL